MPGLRRDPSAERALLPECGTSYRNGTRTPAPPAPPGAGRRWDPSLWTSIRFGFGLAVGTFLFGLLLLTVFLLFAGGLLRTLFGV